MRRRPDVREAITSASGAINGNFNVNSLSVASLFVPASRAYIIGPSISILIFEAARLRGTLALRESQKREAAIAFQKTVIAPWQEADDALTAYPRRSVNASTFPRPSRTTKSRRRPEARQHSAVAQTGAAVANFYPTSTQATLLRSESDLTDVDTLIAVDLVCFYRLLGGGWELTPLPPSPRPHWRRPLSHCSRRPTVARVRVP